MAVRMTEASEARPRLKMRGSISGNADYAEVMKAIPQVINGGKALEVELDVENGFPDVKDRKKIPFLFCSSLRRWFANNGIPAECYQSGPRIVTVRRAAKAPKKPIQHRR